MLRSVTTIILASLMKGMKYMEKNAAKTAAIYARFSSSNQREESIDAQLRICQRYAADNGYTVVREYSDSAISGRTDQRPAFQQMIADSAKGLFSTLLIYSHDRFSRDKYDTATYKAKLKKNGVRIISATLPLDDSPESGLMESIMEGFAQYYSENLSRTIRRGMEENALHCKSNGAAPLGYKVDNGAFVLDPVGAKAVQTIFEMFADGYSKKEICEKLNADGYKTRNGKEFLPSGLHSILANERYLGIYIYGEVRQEGGLPAIIPKELFDRVQDQVRARQRSRGRKKSMEEYLLSGKVFCGRCGKLLVGESGTSATGETYRYYKCATRKRNPKGCHKRVEKKAQLEDVVVAYICREVLTDEMIEQIAEKEFELLDEEACDKNKLMAFEAEYKEASKKIENILEAIENGLYTPKTKERLLDLEAQQSDLETKIVKEKLKKPEFTKDHIVFWLTKFRAGDINDYDYKKAVINALVNSVFVYDDDEDDEDDGNHTRIVVALNLKNTPARTLTCSDVNKMVDHFHRYPNFEVLKYFVLFWFEI